MHLLYVMLTIARLLCPGEKAASPSSVPVSPSQQQVGVAGFMGRWGLTLPSQDKASPEKPKVSHSIGQTAS